MKLLLVPVAVLGALSLSVLPAAGTPIRPSAPSATAAKAAPDALPPLTSGDWAGFRSLPTHVGATASETTLAPGAVSGLHVLGSLATADNEVTSQAAATGHGLVFTSTRSGGVAAYDASTRVLRWSAPLGSDEIAVGPTAVCTVTVASTSPTGDVTAYDVSTGARLWQLALSDAVDANPPTLVGGRLFVSYANAGGSNVLEAVSAATGRPIWRTPIAAPYVPSSVAVGSGMAIFTTGNDELVAIDNRKGTPAWTATSSGAGNPSAEPAIAGGVVYSGFADGTVRAYSATTGALKWSRNLGGEIFGAITVSQGVVYVTPSSTAPASDLVALRAATGATLWSVYAHVASSSPTVADGVVYVSRTDTDPELDAYAAKTGVQLAHVPLAGFALSEAAVSHGRLYLRIASGITDVLGL